MRKRWIILAVVGGVLCLILAAFAALSLFARMRRHERPITKIGAIINGSIQDRSYSQAQYDALVAVSEKMRLELTCYDNVPADEAFPALVERLISEGCGVIISDSYLYEPYLLELAAANPRTYFLNASGTESAENYSSYFGRIYQVRYLAGIVAGIKTKTNEIGYVLSCLTPETIRQLNAFTIGVRMANPDAKVYARRADDWNDDDKAANVAATLLDAHKIDVLTSHINSIAPLSVADERGVYTIGNDYDNRDLFPNTYLTACVFHWELFFEERLTECLNRRFVGRHYWEGVRSGLVSLLPLTELAGSEARDRAGAELRRLLNGEFDVFYGPVRDSYGAIQVRDGENLADRELLYGMYWFVDGVIVE